MKKIILLMMMVLLISCNHQNAFNNSGSGNDQSIIKIIGVDVTDVFTSSEVTSEKIGDMTKGESVVVKSEFDSVDGIHWFEIEYEDSTGWIQSQYTYDEGISSDDIVMLYNEEEQVIAVTKSVDVKSLNPIKISYDGKQLSYWYQHESGYIIVPYNKTLTMSVKRIIIDALNIESVLEVEKDYMTIQIVDYNENMGRLTFSIGTENVISYKLFDLNTSQQILLHDHSIEGSYIVDYHDDLNNNSTDIKIYDADNLTLVWLYDDYLINDNKLDMLRGQLKGDIFKMNRNIFSNNCWLSLSNMYKPAQDTVNLITGEMTTVSEEIPLPYNFSIGELKGDIKVYEACDTSSVSWDSRIENFQVIEFARKLEFMDDNYHIWYKVIENGRAGYIERAMSYYDYHPIQLFRPIEFIGNRVVSQNEETMLYDRISLIEGVKEHIGYHSTKKVDGEWQLFSSVLNISTNTKHEIDHYWPYKLEASEAFLGTTFSSVNQKDFKVCIYGFEDMTKPEIIVELGQASYVELVWKSRDKLQILKNGDHHTYVSLIDGVWKEY